MTHGQAAHRPDANRLSECVALRLFKEFKEARNRPKDVKGKTFGIPPSIVQAYSHIKQLLEDCKEITDQTNLILVPINNTTVSSWWVAYLIIYILNKLSSFVELIHNYWSNFMVWNRLHNRQKRADRDTLLQGVQLPQQVQVASDNLLEVNPSHQHQCSIITPPWSSMTLQTGKEKLWSEDVNVLGLWLLPHSWKRHNPPPSSTDIFVPGPKWLANLLPSSAGIISTLSGPHASYAIFLAPLPS